MQARHAKLSERKVKYLQTYLSCLWIIIFDELSMIGGKSQCTINDKLCKYTGNPEPYGGKHKISFGDYNQVLPVFDKSTAHDYMKSKKSFAPKIQQGLFLFRNNLRDCFIQDHNFRSTPKYASALKKMRDVNPDLETIKLFNARVIGPDTVLPPGTKVLTATNDVRQIYNEIGYDEYLTKNGIKNENDFKDGFEKYIQYLEILADVKFKNIQKHDSTSLNSIYEYVRGLNSKRLKTIQGRLSIFVGAPFMITKNKNINQGIANGIECHLAKIFIKDSSKIRFVKRDGIVIPTTFASNVEGLLLQHDDSYLQDLKIINNLPGHFLLTPQTVLIPQVQVRDLKLDCRVTGFFISLSFSITVHKSQGTTLDNVFIAEYGKHKSGKDGWLYVALSRVNSFKNIYLYEKLYEDLTKYKKRDYVQKMNEKLIKMSKHTNERWGKYLSLLK